MSKLNTVDRCKHTLSFYFQRRLLFVSLFIFSNVALSAVSDKGIPVSVTVVKEQAIYQTIQLTGTVTSPRVAMLSTATSGQVLTVHVDEGDRVKAGDPLLALDAKLANLQWQSTQAQSEQARIALSDTKRRLREARLLLPQRSIAESVVRDLESELVGDQAVLQQRIADTGYQHEILERHHLKAPFSGVVSKKLTELGEWVTPGQGVFEVVATESVRLDFSVAEDYLAQISLDTLVTFRLAANPETIYQGRIGVIVPITDPDARTFLLRVLVNEADSSLIPGMSVHATLQMPTNRQGVVVPRDAIVRHSDGRVTVWTVERKDKQLIVAEKRVSLGVSFDGSIEIREGLSAGKEVVVQGNESLRKGQRIYIKPPHSTSRNMDNAADGMRESSAP